MNIQDVIKRNTTLLNGSQSKNWFAVSLVNSQMSLLVNDVTFNEKTPQCMLVIAISGIIVAD